MSKILNKTSLLSISAFLALILSGSLSQFAAAQDADPLKILMITGGGPWHDYATQKDQIEAGLLERLSNIDITTDYEGADTLTMESTDFHFSRHLQDDWAADFDVVIYNHCNLQVKDESYVKGIIDQHVKHQVPAVMLLMQRLNGGILSAQFHTSTRKKITPIHLPTRSRFWSRSTQS